MRFAAVALIAVCVFALSHAAPLPLDLGGGGVFKGAEAQNYFATRYGSDFFTRLAATMAKSGATSTKSAHAPKPKKDTPELKFVTKHSDSESAAVEGEGKVAGPAISEDVLYRDAVAPSTTKDASEVEVFEEQQTNTV